MARASDLPQIPSIPSSNGDPTIAGIIAVLNPVKEILDVWQGNKGNKYGLDRVVTYNDISMLDPTTFSQVRSTYARIARVTGDIVRTGKIESKDSGTYIDLDNQKIVFNGKINYASKMPGIFIGKDDDNIYKFNLGHDDTGSLKFDGVNTYLGLWSITPNGIGDNLTENSSKIFLDKTNTAIRVGPTSGSYVTVDGANIKVESSNYVSGVAGAGFTLTPDLLEVGNIACRGIFRTAVFQKDVVSAIGGNLMVRPADVMSTDLVALGYTGADLEDATDFLLEDDTQLLFESYYLLTIEGNETFAVGDFLRIKDGINDEWIEVMDDANAPSYIVLRDKGEDYDDDDNPTYTKGATVVNYGASGDGGVYMTSCESNAPYVSVWTHAGEPWDTITTHCRLGNLNGFLGYSSDLYGIAIGSTNKYLKYDPTNHLRIQGNITVTGDNGFVKIYDGTPTERVRLGNLKGFLGYSSDLYGIAIGETTKYLKYDPTNGLRIAGNIGVSGTLSSSDWASDAGVRLDLDNKWLKMGGSDVDATGSAAGVFLGLDTNYKFYVGDGSTTYIKFDATNLSINNGVLTAGSIASSDWAADAGVKIDLTNKYLKMGGSNVDAAGSAAGVFLGLDTSYKFYCGDASDSYLQYDGTDINISLGSGGTFTLIGHDTTPANMYFSGETYSTRLRCGLTDGSSFYITPSDSGGNVTGYFGSIGYPFNYAYIVGSTVILAASEDGAVRPYADNWNTFGDTSKCWQDMFSYILTLKETSTPSADTNYGKIYTKNDNKLYFQDGAGTEHEIAFA